MNTQPPHFQVLDMLSASKLLKLAIPPLNGEAGPIMITFLPQFIFLSHLDNLLLSCEFLRIISAIKPD